jgi:hypothetical protein
VFVQQTDLELFSEKKKKKKKEAMDTMGIFLVHLIIHMPFAFYCFDN